MGAESVPTLSVLWASTAQVPGLLMWVWLSSVLVPGVAVRIAVGGGGAMGGMKSMRHETLLLPALLINC